MMTCPCRTLSDNKRSPSKNSQNLILIHNYLQSVTFQTLGGNPGAAEESHCSQTKHRQLTTQWSLRSRAPVSLMHLKHFHLHQDTCKGRSLLLKVWPFTEGWVERNLLMIICVSCLLWGVGSQNPTCRKKTAAEAIRKALLKYLLLFTQDGKSLLGLGLVWKWHHDWSKCDCPF